MAERWGDTSAWGAPAGERPGAPAGAPAAGALATAAPAARPRVAETFTGPRLRARTSSGRRALAGIGLLLLTLTLAAVLGAALGMIVWGISIAIHHAATA